VIVARINAAPPRSAQRAQDFLNLNGLRGSKKTAGENKKTRLYIESFLAGREGFEYHPLNEGARGKNKKTRLYIESFLAGREGFEYHPLNEGAQGENKKPNHDGGLFWREGRDSNTILSMRARRGKQKAQPMTAGFSGGKGGIRIPSSQ
jgi:hypothetical protein